GGESGPEVVVLPGGELAGRGRGGGNVGDDEHVVVVVVPRGVGDRAGVGRPGGIEVDLLAGGERALDTGGQVTQHQLAQARAGRDVDQPPAVGRDGGMAVLLGGGGDGPRRRA